MGRNTKGRGNRKKGAHTAAEIKKGIDLHLKGKLSLRKAAKEAKIPYPTLRRYVLKYIANPSSRLEPHYDVKKIFSEEQENSIKDYIIECANKFYGLTSKDCRRIAYQMAIINKISTPENWKKEKMAGRDWLRGFRVRHPELSVKKPEACSLARATAFNRVNVTKFFNNLKEVLNRHPSFSNGSRVFNLDETATTTVQRPSKVLAAKGRNVCQITSGERGILVTTCCIVNALGQALPPAMVFPRKNFKPHMLYGAPSGTLGLASPSGWMNTELFIEVMKHFIQYSSASMVNPALLILDNHESHLSIQALDLAKAAGVTVLTLHPHTTARMQPLDVGLNAPFKAFYNSAVDSWLTQHPGRALTIYNVAECVGIAYMRAMTPINITNAFKKCGIFPYDDQIFTDIDFMPSEVTDRAAPDVDDETDAEESSNDLEDESISKAAPDVDDETNAENLREPEGESLLLMNRTSPSVLCTNDENEENIQPQTAVIAPITKKYHSQPGADSKNNLEDVNVPSTSGVGQASKATDTFISPKVFRPPLKAGPRKANANRKAGKSMVATDTPEKQALAEKKKNKTSQKRAKVVKKDLFKNKRKRETSISSDEEDFFKCSGSSSGGEYFINESEDEEIILNNDFPPLARNPHPEDFVIVAFASKKTTVFYVGEVLEELESQDCDYFVSYLKLKSKAKQLFSMPKEPDTAGVHKTDIKYILPRPKISGSTARQQAIYKFLVDMSQLNLRY